MGGKIKSGKARTRPGWVDRRTGKKNGKPGKKK
jgi:hypothetical protein